MSKLHLIPELLNQLVETPDIASASRRVGVSERIVHQWTVQSRGGKPELQEIEFMGVIAPFHIHRENARRLSVDALEAAFLDRCRNGFYVGSYYKGEPVFRKDERIIRELGPEPDPQLCMMLFGQLDADLRDEDGNRVQVMQHMKPSEQAVQAALQHWRNYAARTQVDVSVGGVLRVDSAQPTKLIEQKPTEAFEDSTAGIEADNAGNFLAVHREAKTQDEMTMWQKDGVFAPAAIDFEAEDGTVTTIKQDIAPPAAALAAPPGPDNSSDPVEMTTASATPETAEPTQSGKSALRADLEARLAALKTRGPVNAHPRAAVPVSKPDDEPPPPPAPEAPVHVAPPQPVPEDDPQSGQRVPPSQRVDRPGLGAGTVPGGGYKTS
jgi:hypothetical protein